MRGTCRLLNDCQPGHIIRELEKLVQQPKVAKLEEDNAKLKAEVANLANEVASKSKEIRCLNTKSKESLDRIQNYIGNLGDIFNKARLFKNELKSDRHIPPPKVVAIFVEFNRRMELTLAEMQKLLPAPLFELF